MNCKRKKISSYLYSVDLTHEEAVDMLAGLRSVNLSASLRDLFKVLELEVNGPWPKLQEEEELSP